MLSQEPVIPKSFKEALRAQTHNIRDYGMYIAFVLVVVFFTIATKGLFVSSRNIGNLVNATSYIAVLAVGMTLVIVIRHIDLSVGYLAGTLGAVAGYSLKYWNLPVSVVIPIVLVLGVIAGLVTGVLVAKMRIPAFVATLAGWLLYHGFLQRITKNTGTIDIRSNTFNALGSGNVPDIPMGFLPGVHKVTLLLGIFAIIAFVWNEISKRRRTQAYDFEVIPKSMFVLKLCSCRP
jgi:putative multiple sugar transport system permease protein